MAHVPFRQCIVCRDKHEKCLLIRVVWKKDDLCIVDETQKQPGRGLYICRKTRCLEKARKQDLISRKIGRRISPAIYQELANTVSGNKANLSESLVGFAVRSRKALLGITAISHALTKGKVSLVLIDASMSASSRQRLSSACNRFKVPVFLLDNRLSLGKITGKSNCRSMGLTDPAFSVSIRKAIRLLGT